MGIRAIALFVVVGGLCIYAWRDWFLSLCGLILLMAVIEHDSMPKAVLGISGLNPWNVLFLVISLAWMTGRRSEGLTWDMPWLVKMLLFMYLVVVLVGLVRFIFNLGYCRLFLIVDFWINPLKFALVGILLFDGCRTRRRLLIAIVCLLSMYALIAVQVVRRLPASSVLHADSSINSTRNACSKIGYSAVDMSAMLAGVSWGILAVLPVVKPRKYRPLVLAVAGIVFFGQMLTGGRAGYLAWVGTGLTLCLLKWRRYLILIPVLVLLFSAMFPGAVERMLHGFGVTDVAGESTTDNYAVSSGRLLVWPYVIDKFGQSPLIGFGRMSMHTTGLRDQMAMKGYSDFGHPHNMYLETLLDNGMLGSLPILTFWIIMAVYAGRLFRSGNPLYSAVGGLVLSLVMAQLIAGIGAQHFYPEESTLGVWSAMFLSLRVYCEEKRARTVGGIAENYPYEQLLPQVAVASAATYCGIQQ